MYQIIEEIQKSKFFYYCYGCLIKITVKEEGHEGILEKLMLFIALSNCYAEMDMEFKIAGSAIKWWSQTVSTYL